MWQQSLSILDFPHPGKNPRATHLSLASLSQHHCRLQCHRSPAQKSHHAGAALIRLVSQQPQRSLHPPLTRGKCSARTARLTFELWNPLPSPLPPHRHLRPSAIFHLPLPHALASSTCGCLRSQLRHTQHPPARCALPFHFRWRACIEWLALITHFRHRATH